MSSNLSTLLVTNNSHFPSTKFSPIFNSPKETKKKNEKKRKEKLQRMFCRIHLRLKSIRLALSRHGIDRGVGPDGQSSGGSHDLLISYLTYLLAPSNVLPSMGRLCVLPHLLLSTNP